MDPLQFGDPGKTTVVRDLELAGMSLTSYLPSLPLCGT